VIVAVQYEQDHTQDNGCSRQAQKTEDDDRNHGWMLYLIQRIISKSPA